MNAPLVTVLMTVFNRERYIAAAVDSVLAQTTQDFEVIIVDDASTDGSVEIAQNYAARETRIRFFRNERNLGDYPNRMRAAQEARGRYLKYVDSDDLIYQHSLAIMVEAMEAHPDAALGLSHSMPEDECPYPWKLTPSQAWRKQFLGRGCLSSGPTGAIVRRNAFFEVGGFRDWGVLNDADLWHRLSARWPVLLLPPGLVWWRRHEQQEFTNNNAAIAYLERGFALTMETLSSPECPLTDSERQAALNRARQHHARRLLSLGTRGGQQAQAWSLFRKSGLGIGGLLRGVRRYQ
jgi:glycosyltransferase involved in cell wall biosynthesis